MAVGVRELPGRGSERSETVVLEAKVVESLTQSEGVVKIAAAA